MNEVPPVDLLELPPVSAWDRMAVVAMVLFIATIVLGTLWMIHATQLPPPMAAVPPRAAAGI